MKGKKFRDKEYGENVHWGNLDSKTPLMFSDGTDVYNKLAQKYITHKQGFFILTPSGAGKTYFTEGQQEPHWMDADELWENTNAHPKGPWWLSSVSELIEIEQKSDIITMQAKKLGFWILGSMGDFLKPDAIVLPHWSTHKKYILSRGNSTAEEYDGGATADDFDQVRRHRKRIAQWQKHGVPKFTSAQDATEYLVKKYKQK